MDERRTSPSFGGDDWVAAQQKYWDAWFELARETLRVPSDGGGRHEGADRWFMWWQAMSLAVPPPARDAVAQLVTLCQPYFEMAEAAASSGQGTRAALNDWLDGLSEHLDKPGAAESADLLTGAWSRLFVPPVPSNLFWTRKTDIPASVEREWRENAERILQIPAIGHLREAQERYQKLARLSIAYLDALRDYNLAFSRMARRSIERFRVNMEKADADKSSLRALYDLWVDACEAAYAEYALSEEYSMIYGRLVNAQVALQRHQHALVDETLQLLNLPTRREIDTVHRHMHETRRENRALRAELAELKDRLERDLPELGTRVRTRRKAKHH